MFAALRSGKILPIKVRYGKVSTTGPFQQLHPTMLRSNSNIQMGNKEPIEIVAYLRGDFEIFQRAYRA